MRDPRLRGATRAFTLVEMLVVLAIIGLVLAISLPSFRGMNEGRSMESAARQLMDDIAFARQSAIATRSTVAIVFIPPEIVNSPEFGLNRYPTLEMRTNVARLQGGALTTYALFAYRQIGEQPGRYTRRYLTDWRTLPEKVFVAQDMFSKDPETFAYSTFPFPTADSPITNALPYIAFTPQGQCLPVISPFTGQTDKSRADDIPIRLAAGSIMYGRDPVTRSVVNWSVQEVPPGNSVTLSNVVRVDWLTGRSKLQRAELTRQ